MPTTTFEKTVSIVGTALLTGAVAGSLAALAIDTSLPFFLPPFIVATLASIVGALAIKDLDIRSSADAGRATRWIGWLRPLLAVAVLFVSGSLLLASATSEGGDRSRTAVAGAAALLSTLGFALLPQPRLALVAGALAALAFVARWQMV